MEGKRDFVHRGPFKPMVDALIEELNPVLIWRQSQRDRLNMALNDVFENDANSFVVFTAAYADAALSDFFSFGGTGAVRIKPATPERLEQFRQIIPADVFDEAIGYQMTASAIARTWRAAAWVEIYIWTKLTPGVLIMDVPKAKERAQSLFDGAKAALEQHDLWEE